MRDIAANHIKIYDFPDLEGEDADEIAANKKLKVEKKNTGGRGILFEEKKTFLGVDSFRCGGQQRDNNRRERKTMSRPEVSVGRGRR